MPLQRITAAQVHPLFDTATTRRIERAAQLALPSHALMQQAGLAVARLALSVAPHARQVWIACGPGNNGGDGLEAAVHLKQAGKQVVVTWLGAPEQAPADALASFHRARDSGVTFSDHPPARWDLSIDALLGIGAKAAPHGRMAQWIASMGRHTAPVLAVDVPTGLNADTGAMLDTSITIAKNDQLMCRNANYTLSLLTLKPGLFTAHGRDMAGEVWLDTLGVDPQALAASEGGQAQPQASQGARPSFAPHALHLGEPPTSHRLHASHKGSYGDVAIVGGAAGMTGAALLAATAALHAGAGRVFVSLLDANAPQLDLRQTELMFRHPASLAVEAMAVVCGCGGGTAVRAALPALLRNAKALVLDADALNAIAHDPWLQMLLKNRSMGNAAPAATVLTPHPLEAARLLGNTAQAVQTDRLVAAQQLANQFQCTVMLKGSGTVIADPHLPPAINTTGNARLATAGTGDVLAGLIGALLAAGLNGHEAACQASYRHGHIADEWPAGLALTAGRLARRLSGI